MGVASFQGMTARSVIISGLLENVARANARQASRQTAFSILGILGLRAAGFSPPPSMICLARSDQRSS
jgi:hypothetical protein